MPELEQAPNAQEQNALPLPEAPKPPAPPSGALTTPQDPGEVDNRPIIVTAKDGSKHMFPAGTNDDQIRKQLKLGPTPVKKSEENLVDKVRPWIAGAAGLGGGALAGLATENPVVGLAAETQAYALTDSALKYAGANPPSSYSEALKGSEADAAINAVAGKLINGIWKGGKAILNADQPEFYKLAPTFSQALEKYGMKALATGAQFLEDYGIPVSKAAALDRSAGKGFTQALAHANTLNGRMATTNSNPNYLYDKVKLALKDGIDTMLNPEFEGKVLDVNKKANAVHYASKDALDLLAQGTDHLDTLRNVIEKPEKLAQVLKVGSLTGSSAMNVKRDLAAFHFMDLVTKATVNDVKTGARINTDMLGTMWNDAELAASHNTLYGKEGVKRIGEFFNDLGYVQKMQGANPTAGKWLRYGSTAGKFIMGSTALTHALMSGNWAPLGITTGIQIGASTMGRLLTNPATARIMSEMAKGTLKENPTWVARMIGTALKNETVGAIGGKGEVTNGSIEENPETGMFEFKPIK